MNDMDMAWGEMKGNPYAHLPFKEAIELWRKEFPELAAQSQKPFDTVAYYDRIARQKDRDNYENHLQLATTLLQTARLSPSRAHPLDWANFVKVLARAIGNDWDYGFLFTGRPGNGKSTLLRTIRAHGWTGHNSGQFWAYATAGELSKEMIANATKSDSDRTWDKSHLCIDELGGEPLQNNYGQKNEMLGTVLDARERATSFGGITIIATNLTEPEMQKRYGDRAYSRLQSLCAIISMRTGDNRPRAGYEPEAQREEGHERPEF